MVGGGGGSKQHRLATGLSSMGVLRMQEHTSGRTVSLGWGSVGGALG